MGNIVSIIENEEKYNLTRHPRPALAKIPEYKLNEVRTPAAWTGDREKLARRKERWAKKKKYNDKVYKFLTSRSLITPKKSDDGLFWEATELLGAGAFGVVGLWQQLDSRGNPRDSVAIKETLDDDPKGFIEITERMGDMEPIPSEALWMDFLSRRTHHIPNLRQMVHFRGSNSKRWRFYMEYCPNGNLTDLIKVYQEYNETHDKKDEQIIPEAYVWFVFYGLAKALEAMDLPKGQGQFIDRDLKHRVPEGHRYILHLDIKGDNTLLGKASSLKALEHYPPAKLADYGLAQLTHKSHPDNSKRFRGMGTSVWMPPEQYDNGHLDYRWRIDAIHPGRNASYPYDQTHGVWGIAAIVYGMTALNLHNFELYDFIKDICHDPNGENKVLDRGLSLLKDRKITMRDDYSDKLYSTLDRCLNLCPSKRLTPEQLVKVCENAMADLGVAAERKGQKKPSVFYGVSGLYDLRDHVRRRRRSPPPQRKAPRR